MSWGHQHQTAEERALMAAQKMSTAAHAYLEVTTGRRRDALVATVEAFDQAMRDLHEERRQHR